MRILSPFQNLLFRAGALLMVVGLCAFLFIPRIALFVYAAGAMCYGAMQLQASYDGRNVVILRLRRQQLLGCVCLLLVVVGMSMQVFSYGPLRRNEWVVALAIGTMLQLYTAWRIPSEIEKEVKKS